MSLAKDTTESLIVDGEACPIKYRDRNGNPLLTRNGNPRQRKPGAGRPRKFEIRFKMPHMSVRGWRASSYICSEAGQRGKRDPWFLASSILHRVYPDVVEAVHKPMCEFFVHKDPKKRWLLQDTVKNRLLLAPRGHFKTTINLCDIIQRMLAFPDITIACFPARKNSLRVWSMKSSSISF